MKFVTALALVLCATAAHAQSGTRIVTHSMSDFLDGELDGLSVGPIGELVGAPVSRERFFTPSLYIWSLALDSEGRLMAGTGDDGGVVRQEGDTFVELAKFEDQLVMDLVDTPSGVFAATGPEGRVYRIADGETEVVLQREEPTVWTLERTADGGSWLAGTGPDAFIVRFDGTVDGESEVVDSYEASVVRILQRDGDHLWAVTQGPALIYQSTDDPDHPDRLRHDAGSNEIPAVVSDGAGGLWFIELNPGDPDQLLGPSSKLKHLPADGSAETIFEGELALMSLAMAEDGALLAGEIGASRVHRITTTGRIGLWRDFGDGDASALLADGDVTWIGSSNLGDIFRLAPPEKGRGTFTSAPIPTPAVERWGQLWVDGSAERVRFAVRSGMRSEPDESWSDWSGWKEPGAPMEAPLADYFQYRISLEGAEVTRVNVSWARRNHAPRINGIFFSEDTDWSDPESNSYGNGNSGNGSSVSHLRRTATIRVDARDPDYDDLSATVEVQRGGEGTWYPLLENSGLLSADWDTTQFEDGIWRARATVADAAETAQLVSAPVRIDNTPARLANVERGASALRFRVEDDGSRIARVELRREGEEEWARIEPDDGVTDGETEVFSIALPASAVAVWIRVRDVAGNEVVFSPRLDQ